MSDIAAAVSQDPSSARRDLEALWATAGDDPLRRCQIAHFLADLQDSVADELAWDEHAPAAIAGREDAVRAFLPSLHLSLADDHRRLGDFTRARSHFASAGEHLEALADDEYGTVVRTAAEKIEQALAERSTDPLT